MNFINDADYQVTNYGNVDGRNKIIWMCPYYAKWRYMINRVNGHSRNDHVYKDVSICEEWSVFSNFKKWMQSQDWEGKQLDKDLLSKGSGKVYSPECCIFLHRVVNSFLCDSRKARGAHKIGVSYIQRLGKFQANCRNPFLKKYIYLGLYDTEDQAHIAWKKYKHQMACELADSEYVDDERVRIALKNRYK